MSSDTTFDADLKKAFQELQAKVITTTQQVKLAEAQMAQLSRNITHAKLTDQELSSLPENTRTYQAVGRMFLLEPIDQVRSDLKKKIGDGEAKIKTIEQNKEYLQKSVKDHENSIREMLSARR
ncbi:prefoldin subunit 1-like [Hydractinia symbiolongicarpus]|uniref:prefoldin subunit 1-like n=1 Tax=Hydractinia symbiolongicarpus TaxID=13093 RepID=UPI00254AB18D|nr:prefoldin subunit 1-like [Hydractinia symbiolongicarpus]